MVDSFRSNSGDRLVRDAGTRSAPLTVSWWLRRDESSARRGTWGRGGDTRIRIVPPLPTGSERGARAPGRGGTPRHLDAMGRGRVCRARRRRPGARGARDLPQLRRRTAFRPRLFRPSIHRSVSIRLSRFEHAAKRDAGGPSGRVRRSARRARYRSDRRHRRISRCDIGVATGPASSGEGEASRCARRQPAGKPHRRRPTVIGEAIQPATPPVGTTTRSPRTRRASARPSAFPARGLSASNREGT